MAETKKESYTGTINGEQRRGIESELISRGMYDNMRSIASNIAVPNSSGLKGDLGVE
jgi:glutaminase